MRDSPLSKLGDSFPVRNRTDLMPPTKDISVTLVFGLSSHNIRVSWVATGAVFRIPITSNATSDTDTLSLTMGNWFG